MSLCSTWATRLTYNVKSNESIVIFHLKKKIRIALPTYIFMELLYCLNFFGKKVIDFILTHLNNEAMLVLTMFVYL